MNNTETPENIVDFDEMLGEELDFYGVDGTCFKLDDVIYEAVERNDRLDEVRECDRDKYHRFHASPIARVVIEECEDNRAYGYQLTDLHDGHCWLRFGTEDYFTGGRSYDTTFLFDYTPKAPIGND